jgi:hypothetical protein
MKVLTPKIGQPLVLKDDFKTDNWWDL